MFATSSLSARTAFVKTACILVALWFAFQSGQFSNGLLDAQLITDQFFPTTIYAQTATREGTTVLLGDEYIFAGQPDFDGTDRDTGSVEIYDRATHQHVVNLTVSNANGYRFGASMAYDSGLLAVGEAYSSAVYIFDVTSGDPWTPAFTLTPPVADTFDYQTEPKVAVEGNLVAVGTLRDINYPGGFIYVYDLDSKFPETPVLRIENSTDWFWGGESLAIEGNLLVFGNAGANRNSLDVGEVVVFDLASSDPATPVLIIPSPTPATFGVFGYQIGIEDRVIVANDPYDANAIYGFDLDSADPTVPSFQIAPSGVTEFGFNLILRDGIVLASKKMPGPLASVVAYHISAPGLPLFEIEQPGSVGNSFGPFGIDGDVLIAGARLGSRAGYQTGETLVYDLGSTNPSVPIDSLYHFNIDGRDSFGSSVALSDDWIVVGANGTPGLVNGNAVAGLVYVYDRDSYLPGQPSFAIQPQVSGSFFRFAEELALDGSILVTGTPNGDNGGQDSGIVHVFDLDSADPDVPTRTLVNPSPTIAGRFGRSVVLEDDRLVVGAKEENRSGFVYVYDLSQSSNQPVVSIPNPDPATQKEFGAAVALRGNLIVVGAPGLHTSAPQAVYVFDLDSSDPETPVHTIRPGGNWAAFGAEVKLSDEFLVVGAPIRGRAFVYRLNSLPLLEFEITNQIGDTNGFGTRIELEGDRCVIAPEIDFEYVKSRPYAFVFDLNSAAPMQPVMRLRNPRVAGSHNPLGLPFYPVNSIALRGEAVLMGFPTYSGLGYERGAAYLFALDENGTSPESINVERGEIFSGSTRDTAASDDVDLVVSRDPLDLTGRIVIEASTTSEALIPSTLEFTLESSVFARDAVNQQIEFFNYETSHYESLDSRAASRFNDSTVSVSATGDLRRFLDPQTCRMKTRITYTTSAVRARFSARVDTVRWQINGN